MTHLDRIGNVLADADIAYTVDTDGESAWLVIPQSGAVGEEGSESVLRFTTGGVLTGVGTIPVE